MGLFSFLKKAGASVITKKETAKVKTDEIKKLETKILNKQKEILLAGVVSSLGIKVKDQKISFSGDKATVSGTVSTNEEREKIILAMGNVSGVATVSDKMTVKKKTPVSTMYTVKKGDTLGKIAKAHYGNAKKYKEIFAANQPMLKSPDKIFPGQVLRIPPAKK